MTFETVPDTAQPTPGKRNRAKAAPHRETGSTRTQSGLLEELQYTRHRLQETMEELETANEEFKATNEELQSNNEELQSTNEEMETAKEELQSLNEELVTLNAELQGKLDELASANDDLHNLLNSTEVATIFLDTHLRIRRFTQEAGQIAGLIPADIGRPLSDIALNLSYPNVCADAQEVLRSLTPKEIELQITAGTWYFMRVLPYRTAENLIDGVVIAFLDISRQKQSEQAAKAAQFYAESIVETVQEPLLVLDSSLCVVSANPAFYRAFDLSPPETLGKRIYSLSNGEWHIPQLRELLEQVLPHDRMLEHFTVDHHFPRLGHRKLIISARRLEEDTHLPAHILVVFQDKTDTVSQDA